MLRILALTAIIISVFSLLSFMIPDSFNDKINEAFVYFLSSTYALGFLFHVSTVMLCFQILLNFFLGVAIFYIFKFFLSFIS